jgi:hypothetical protein
VSTKPDISLLKLTLPSKTESVVLDAIGRADFHDKFGAFDAGQGAAGDDLDAARLAAMEKGEDAIEEMQAVGFIARVQRLDFQLRQGAEPQHALVGPAEGDGTVGASAHAVESGESLIGGGQHPIGGPVPHDLHRAAKFHDANGIVGLRASGFGPRRAQSQTREQYYQPDDCDQWFHMRSLFHCFVADNF